jgi:Spy/CpxP family protein refolding chaperone
MTKTITIATAVLLCTASLAFAQTSGTTSPGASQNSPGHEMQRSKKNTGPGASEYSPGDRMHDQGTVGRSKGASELSPGDQMNDKRKH